MFASFIKSASDLFVLLQIQNSPLNKQETLINGSGRGAPSVTHQDPLAASGKVSTRSLVSAQEMLLDQSAQK